MDGHHREWMATTLTPRQEPGLTQGGGGRVHAAIPRLQLRWLEGQTHNLAAEPAAAMAKEFFPGR